MTRTTNLQKVAVVIPNWNGLDELPACLDSLLRQSLSPRIIVVENGSVDGSLEFIQENYPSIELVIHKKNKGFAGGVNAGIRKSMADGDNFVALFNNDAVADKDWLKNLVGELEAHSDTGIATCKFMSIDQKRIDSTGEYYTTWGLPYSRGRGEPVSNKYDGTVEIFGASGGASLYRISMLLQIGIFDEDFFAYYEDIDLSFRAQLAGWKVHYVPTSLAYHHIGATSGKIKGFTTYQSMKNQPLVLFKNVPRKYLWRIGWRFSLANNLFLIRAVSRGQGWPAVKGSVKGIYLLCKKVGERHRIQRTKVVSNEYIWQHLVHDLPPNAQALRKFRAQWWALTGRK